MSKLLRSLGLAAAVVVAAAAGVAVEPAMASATCIVTGDCYPDDNNDPWWEENCWDRVDGAYCCDCEGTVTCVKIGQE